ncbi:MAG: MFS transporter [Betaproteobacteria bacterium]|nr:MFS transporter [Betaproteobacteria bacterium]
MPSASPVPAWFVVLVTTAAQMVVAMSNIVLSTIAPKVAESLGVNPVLVGYQVGLTFGAAALASAYGGVVAMRIGSAFTTQVSMVFSVIGLSLFALPHVGFIALGSLAVGIGSGLASPAASYLLANHTSPDRRNLMFSIKQTGVPVGGVIVALTAPLLAVTVGWRWALAMIAAMAVAILLVTERARVAWDGERRPAGGVPSAPFGGVPLVWREKSLRWIALAAVLFSSVQRVLLSFTVVYLVAEGGYGLVEAGVMLSVAQVGGSIFRIPWGWLADRLKSGLAVLTLICVIMIVASVLLVLLDASWPKSLVMLLFFVLGASCVGWNGIVHAECARLSPPGMISLVAGGTSFFVFGGVMLGPTVFAAAYGVIGSYSATFALMVVLGVAALVLLRLARRQERGDRRAATGNH